MAHTVAKLIDTSTCIGCKACEAACQEWNENGFTVGSFEGTYQTQRDLGHQFWNLIKFTESPEQGDSFWWHFTKYQCMHCVDPGCLAACPAPGAIVRDASGIVDFDHDLCIGCGYCITGCPFDVPRQSPTTQKVYKCTLCSDRTSAGLEPACVKACPTGCLSFGTRETLLADADRRAADLRDQGFAEAGVYNPAGVGGTHVLYVLKDASRPEDFGLPRDPQVPWAVRLWKGPMKWVGNALMVGTMVAAAAHYLRYGPRQEHDDGSTGN